MDYSSLAGTLRTHFHSGGQLVLLDWQPELTCVRGDCTTVQFVADIALSRLPQAEAAFRKICPFGGKLVEDRFVLRAACSDGEDTRFQLGGEFVFRAGEVDFVYGLQQPVEHFPEAALQHPLAPHLERVHDVGEPAMSSLKAWHRARRIYQHWRNWPLALVTVDYRPTPFTRMRAWYRFPEGERVHLQVGRPAD